MGGRCGREIGGCGKEDVMVTRVHADVDGILDQSLELKPPSNSAAQNHGKVR